MATFGEIKTNIANALTDGALQDPSDALIGDKVNSVIRHLSNRHFWFMNVSVDIELEAGVGVLPDIPEDFKSQEEDGALVVIIDNRPYPLTQISSLRFDQLDSQQIGTPWAYVYRNGQIEIMYIPQQNYTIRMNYRAKPPVLVEDEDTNVFTENADRLVEFKALEEIFTVRGNWEAVAKYKDLAREEYSLLMDETAAREGRGEITPYF